MRFIFGILVTLLLAAPCVADDTITKVTSPAELVAELNEQSAIPKELEGLQWNRWTSKNFTVIAIDDVQAQYLHEHLELMKVWVLKRWGLADVSFSAECKVIGVSDPALFKRFFNLDASKVEVRRDENGRIKESVMFLLLNDRPSKTVPIGLSEICLAEFAQRQNVKLGFWARRGISLLDGTLEQIRERIAEIKVSAMGNEPLFFSKGLLETDEVEYRKLDPAKQRCYDNCAMLFCLMVRKEFGQDDFLSLLRAAQKETSERSLQTVLHFKNYDHFDRSFKRYLLDVTNDVTSGKTPDSYLQVVEKR